MVRLVKRVVQVLVGGAGLVFLTILALCFTPYPWRAYAWLARDGHVLITSPDVLVLMGGGGIPSESGLMRSYVLAQMARKYPNAMVAVAMPDTNDVSCIRMREELMLRGIAPDRMVWEDQGRNTREQALRLHDHALRGWPGARRAGRHFAQSHVKRTLLTFRKAGFHDVTGLAEFGESLNADMHYAREELGGKTALPLPDIGQSLHPPLHLLEQPAFSDCAPSMNWPGSRTTACHGVDLAMYVLQPPRLTFPPQGLRYRAMPVAWVASCRHVLIAGGSYETESRLRHAMMFDWVSIRVVVARLTPFLRAARRRDLRINLHERAVLEAATSHRRTSSLRIRATRPGPTHRRLVRTPSQTAERLRQAGACATCTICRWSPWAPWSSASAAAAMRPPSPPSCGAGWVPKPESRLGHGRGRPWRTCVAPCPVDRPAWIC
jgi:uncharacterized SAM-binding protein YcdF (DUF218 family)